MCHLVEWTEAKLIYFKHYIDKLHTTTACDSPIEWIDVKVSLFSPHIEKMFTKAIINVITKKFRSGYHKLSQISQKTFLQLFYASHLMSHSVFKRNFCVYFCNFYCIFVISFILLCYFILYILLCLCLFNFQYLLLAILDNSNLLNQSCSYYLFIFINLVLTVF